MKSASVGSLIMATFVLFSAVSCVKDNDDNPRPSNNNNNTTPITQGGKGGINTLRVIPQHMGSDVDSCFIYLAYNTLDTTRRFDDSMLCKPINGRPTAVFTHLKRGNYFVSAKGWDIYKSVVVSGTISYTLNDSTTDYTLFLPVEQ